MINDIDHHTYIDYQYHTFSKLNSALLNWLLQSLLSLILLLLPFNLLASYKNPIDLLDLEFSNPALKVKALQPRTEVFERLEFLGDRVFGLVTAHLLYKCYSSKSIGWLDQVFASLVSKPSLAAIYNGFGVDPLDLLSSCYHPPVTGLIAEKTASDIVEALMGALYIDQGFEAAQQWGENLIRTYYDLSEGDDEHYLVKLPVRGSSLTYITFMQNRGLPKFQDVISYQFKNNLLLYDAFRHPSMGGDAFKKLNFLGVRILELAIAEKIYLDYPDVKEGYLMQQFENIISNDNVRRVFQSWKMGRYLVRQDPGLFSLRFASERIPLRMAVDTVRSLVAAVYLDGDWKSAFHVTCQLFFTECPQDIMRPVVKHFEQIAFHSEKHLETLDNEEKSEEQSGEVGNDVATSPAEIWPSLGRTDSSDNLTGHLSIKELPSQQSYLKALKSKKLDQPVQQDDKVKEEWPALNSQQFFSIYPHEESACQLPLDYASLIPRYMHQASQKHVKHVTQNKPPAQQNPWPELGSSKPLAKNPEKSVNQISTKNAPTKQKTYLQIASQKNSGLRTHHKSSEQPNTRTEQNIPKHKKII